MRLLGILITWPSCFKTFWVTSMGHLQQTKIFIIFQLRGFKRSLNHKIRVSTRHLEFLHGEVCRSIAFLGSHVILNFLTSYLYYIFAVCHSRCCTTQYAETTIKRQNGLYNFQLFHDEFFVVFLCVSVQYLKQIQTLKILTLTYPPFRDPHHFVSDIFMTCRTARRIKMALEAGCPNWGLEDW